VVTDLAWSQQPTQASTQRQPTRDHFGFLARPQATTNLLIFSLMLIKHA
jgi:hypothetical protein